MTATEQGDSRRFDNASDKAHSILCAKWPVIIISVLFYKSDNFMGTLYKSLNICPPPAL